MKIHFAGSDANIKVYRQLMREGAKCRLLSFASLMDKSNIGPLWPADQLLMYSGGFVIRTRGAVLKVEQYAEFLHRHGIAYAFNMDTESVQESIQNQRTLERLCPRIYFLPVYHIEDFLTDREWLQDLVKEYRYIGIGGIVKGGWKPQTRNAFYKYIFRHCGTEVAVHALGLTTESYLRRYPFYSIDSTAWIAGARYGHSVGIKDPLLKQYYRSVPSHYYRNFKNLHKSLEMCDRVTTIWESRGVKWPHSIAAVVHKKKTNTYAQDKN